MALFGVSSSTFNAAVTNLQNQINMLKTNVGALVVKEQGDNDAQETEISALRATMATATSAINAQIDTLKADLAALPAPFDPAPFQAQLDALKPQIDALNLFMGAAYKQDPTVLNINSV